MSRAAAAAWLGLVMCCTLWGSLLITLPAFSQASTSQNPHGTLPVGLSCESCHTPQGWSPLRPDIEFDHQTQTAFPLIGSHIETSCQSCHLNLVFSEPQITGESCTTCHVDVHQGAFPQSCEDCHNQVSFQEVDGIQIHARTTFPLLGAHMQIACESCHVDQNIGHFNLNDTECIDCHGQDYLEAETIAHEESGFSTNCSDCHSLNAWQPATFDHQKASGGFALLGAHELITCASCHVIPTMETLFNAASDQDCFACHADDYQDEHAGSGFPTNCVLCHNVNTWDDARFEDHDRLYFPIFSGEHKGEWNNDCRSCHVAPSDFSVFSCITCHEHNQTDMDREHRGVNGYIYQSDACYSCHPNGSEDDAEGGNDD